MNSRPKISPFWRWYWLFGAVWFLYRAATVSEGWWVYALGSASMALLNILED
jgi:hypothetical protein